MALDPYVKIIDNEFVLELPEDNNFDPALVMQAYQTIEISNDIITKEELIIDPISKTATTYQDGIQLMAYKEGVNSISFHWSHAKINLSKSTVTAVQGVAFGGLSFITSQIPSVTA
jgi:hypothetical protein